MDMANGKCDFERRRVQKKNARTESPMYPLELDTIGAVQGWCNKFRTKQKKHQGQNQSRNHTIKHERTRSRTREPPARSSTRDPPSVAYPRRRLRPSGGQVPSRPVQAEARQAPEGRLRLRLILACLHDSRWRRLRRRDVHRRHLL